jgi:hypothetical protein
MPSGCLIYALTVLHVPYDCLVYAEQARVADLADPPAAKGPRSPFGRGCLTCAT